jgi:uncharacterized membrane protein YeaQ/YmgE (transglycosylase-associated protein family)
VEIVILLIIVIALVAIGAALLGAVLSLLWWVLIGALIGVLGRLLIPEHRRPGVLGTVLAGIAGSMIGGLLANALEVGRVLEFGIAVLVAAGLIGIFSNRGEPART